jgi:hypothetical protein
MSGGAALERGAEPRLSIGRRSLVELPLAAASGAFGSGAALPVPTSGATLRPGVQDLGVASAESDVSSVFDVPAFLRRQEG